MNKHERITPCIPGGAAVGAWRRGGSGARPRRAGADARTAQIGAAQRGRRSGHHGASACPQMAAGMARSSTNDHAPPLAAFAERIMRARGHARRADAGVLNYIDWRSPGPTPTSRISIARARRARCPLPHDLRKPFRAAQCCPAGRGDRRARGRQSHGLHLAVGAGVFNTLRTHHTYGGMFADPVYGGNKDFAGWVLVGFPGAQPLFSPADYAEQGRVSQARRSSACRRSPSSGPEDVSHGQPKRLTSSSSAPVRPGGILAAELGKAG